MGLSCCVETLRLACHGCWDDGIVDGEVGGCERGEACEGLGFSIITVRDLESWSVEGKDWLCADHVDR